MAILLIIIAILLFFIAKALYKVADNNPSEKATIANGSYRKIPMEVQKSPCISLYRGLTYEEKLNIMCLMFYFGGLAQSPEAKSKSQKIVRFIAKCMGMDMDDVANYVLKQIGNGNHSLASVVSVVSSISSKDVKDAVISDGFDLCSLEPSRNASDSLMSIALQLGYSPNEVIELIQKKKAISDTLNCEDEMHISTDKKRRQEEQGRLEAIESLADEDDDMVVFPQEEEFPKSEGLVLLIYSLISDVLIDAPLQAWEDPDFLLYEQKFGIKVLNNQAYLVTYFDYPVCYSRPSNIDIGLWQQVPTNIYVIKDLTKIDEKGKRFPDIEAIRNMKILYYSNFFGNHKQ